MEKKYDKILWKLRESDIQDIPEWYPIISRLTATLTEWYEPTTSMVYVDNITIDMTIVDLIDWYEECVILNDANVSYDPSIDGKIRKLMVVNWASATISVWLPWFTNAWWDAGWYFSLPSGAVAYFEFVFLNWNWYCLKNIVW